MTALMDHAIASLRHIPPEQQDEMARAVMQLAGIDQPVYVLSSEEIAEVEKSDAAAERGAFATDEQVRAIWAKHGL